jgi:Flp pilus assembly protein TadG
MRLAFLRADRGGAAIEFAIVAPVLFLIVLSMVDFGRMFYVTQGLQYATQKAARYYTLNPTAATSTVTTQLTQAMVGNWGSSVSVAYADTTNCNANSKVTCTMITATCPFAFVVGYFGSGSRTITATSEAIRSN